MSETSIPALIAHLGQSERVVTVINPSTAKPLFELPQHSAEQVELVIEKAREAQPAWAATPVKERAEILLRINDLILEHEQQLLDIVQLETGKSRGHAFEEFGGAVNASRYYGKVAVKTLKVKRVPGGFPIITKTYVDQVPMGVVGIITPWNYPLALAALDVLPALAAGNAVVQKTDNQTTLTGLYLRHLAIEAGLPATAWTIVAGDGAEVGNAITDNVDYVAFTGSTATGRLVAQRAANRLIGYSLELGGKNPMIVLRGARLGQASEILIGGAFGSAGQLCVSIERVFVPAELKTEFEAELAKRIAKLKLGRSNDYTNDIGSLTSANQVDRVDGFIQDAIQKGARVISGGHPLIDRGPYFYAPTVLTDLNDSMRLDRNEVFGPVIQVYGYTDIQEAIELANDTEFGLNASVVGPEAEARKVADHLHAGSVNINEGFRTSFSSMDSPMGGMKASGFGRRNGAYGLLRFTEPRAIGVQAKWMRLPANGKEYEQLAPIFRVLSKVLRRL